MVWVIDPENTTVTVYRDRNRITILDSSDMLVGDDILPGFSVAVGSLF